MLIVRIFYQDVSFGTGKLKLDSGECISVPNVVRTVTRSTMISQYMHYCKDENFETLSRATLYQILEVREASPRKSLQGLATLLRMELPLLTQLRKLRRSLRNLAQTKIGLKTEKSKLESQNVT